MEYHTDINVQCTDSMTLHDMEYQWGSVTYEQQLLVPKYSLVALETTTCPSSWQPRSGTNHTI